MAWCYQAKSHYSTQANADPDLCRHVTSLGHNELMLIISIFAEERHATNHHHSPPDAFWFMTWRTKRDRDLIS